MATRVLIEDDGKLIFETHMNREPILRALLFAAEEFIIAKYGLSPPIAAWTREQMKDYNTENLGIPLPLGGS